MAIRERSTPASRSHLSMAQAITDEADAGTLRRAAGRAGRRMTRVVGRCRSFVRPPDARGRTMLWGLAAAAIGYAAIRGGLLNIDNSAVALNPFAVFAIGAVFGLNSSDGLNMLKGILRPTPKPELIADDKGSDDEAGAESEVAVEPSAPIEPTAAATTTADAETTPD